MSAAMSEQKNGGPAFPCDDPVLIVPEDLRNDHRIHQISRKQNGMSLRDYFAAKALPAVHAEYMAAFGERGLSGAEYRRIAADAYLLADAMLKAGQS